MPPAQSATTRRPAVSVIIPVLNEANYIGRQLRYLRQLRGLSEIIVVDGGSEDESAEIARAFEDMRLIEAPRGRAVQMNAGAREASGDVLLFLHADVLLPSDAAYWIARAFADPGVVAGAFRTWTVDDPDHLQLGPLLHLADFRSRYTSLPYGDQGIFVRKRVFAAIGGFLPLPLMEDLNLAQRLAKIGRIITAPSRVLVSGRRFQTRPIFYTTLVNVFPALYHLGIPPSCLERLYGSPR